MQGVSWRWTCWVPVSFICVERAVSDLDQAIASASLELAAYFFLKECYIPTLLQRKLAMVKPGNPCAYTVLDLRNESRPKGARALLSDSMRPIIYLVLDPALSLLSLYFAVVFGILYLVVVTFYTVFGEGYGHSAGIVGVDLLSEGIGAFIGLIATIRLFNIVYRRNEDSKATYKHESRLITAFGGSFLVGGGLFMYGFSALRTHFMVPLVGVAIFSFGLINVFLAIQLYIIDSFDYPASAVSALNTLRCAFAGAFPLFGKRLFEALGLDWGVGLLAFLSLGLGLPFLPMVSLS